MEENGTSNGMQLNSEQTDKVIQFQDLTGIDDFDRCSEILQSHHWDLEVAVRTALDDTSLNSSTSSLNQPSTSDRHIQTQPPLLEDHSTNTNNNVSSRTTPGGHATGQHTQQLTVWSFTTRLLTFPFAFIYDTILSILRFAWTLIRPDPRRIVVDPTGDVLKFISDYESCFGSSHPVFYRGTYSQALNDAKRELKFLLVYLHSDQHQDTRDFCVNVFGHQEVIDFLNHNNLLFWGCSVQLPEGYRVSQALREHTYPFLALIVLKNNRMVVVGRFEGKLNRQELVTRLRRCIDDNEASLVAARLEREERNMANMLRREQDEAYLASLKVDKAKEEKKKEERIKKEAEEMAKKQQELEVTKRRDRLMQLKLDLVSRIPEEPAATDPEMTKIVIKLPNGTRLERRFLKSQSIKFLYYFVFCQDQSPLRFQIRTNFPSRDLPGKPPEPEDFEEGNQLIEDPPSFEDCDLAKGVMLFVHDLEA